MDEFTQKLARELLSDPTNESNIRQLAKHFLRNDQLVGGLPFARYLSQEFHNISWAPEALLPPAAEIKAYQSLGPVLLPRLVEILETGTTCERLRALSVLQAFPDYFSFYQEAVVATYFVSHPLLSMHARWLLMLNRKQMRPLAWAMLEADQLPKNLTLENEQAKRSQRIVELVGCLGQVPEHLSDKGIHYLTLFKSAIEGSDYQVLSKLIYEFSKTQEEFPDWSINLYAFRATDIESQTVQAFSEEVYEVELWHLLEMSCHIHDSRYLNDESKWFTDDGLLLTYPYCWTPFCQEINVPKIELIYQIGGDPEIPIGIVESTNKRDFTCGELAFHAFQALKQTDWFDYGHGLSAWLDSTGKIPKYKFTNTV